MMGRCEHETDTDGIDTARHLLGRQVEKDPGRLEQIGTAALAGYRTIAVLGHLAASSRNDERGSGGHVEDVHPVATGATGVDQLVGVETHRSGQLAHDLHGADDLVDGFALHAHAHEKRADLRVCALTGHDLAHHRLHFLGGQIQLADDAVEGFLDIHQRTPPVCFRKFANSSWPWSVRIDSGWNCTPSMFSVLCRSPMISSTEPSAN